MATPTTETATTAAATTLPCVSELLRPSTKPRLLTEEEYETLWDANMDTLRIGVLLSLNAKDDIKERTIVRKAISVIRMAVEEINNERIIPGVNVSIILRDSQDPSLHATTGGPAAISAAGQLIGAKVGGVIGDVRSELTRYEALMTSSVQIPHCSFASVSTALSDRDTYPYFFRTISTMIPLLESILELVTRLGWKRLTLIYEIDSIGWPGLEYFNSQAKAMGIYVLDTISLTSPGIPRDPTYRSVKDKLHYSQSRVQILICTSSYQYEFLHEMKNSGFFEPQYAWVTTNDISIELRRDQDVERYDGLIMVDNGWNMHDYEPYPEAADPVLDDNEGMAYSCVMMLALGYAHLIKAAIPNPENRVPTNSMIREVIAGAHTKNVDIVGLFMNKSYNGPNGPINLDENGDRTDGSLMIKNYRIYRIFNSVTPANKTFQTRSLIRYLFLAVVLCLIPVIIGLIVEDHDGEKINIHKFQWIRCRGLESQSWWGIGAMAIPVLLIIFGVFLAFQTRNVIFLWNEAKQISFVLYNIFFFAVIIAIVNFLPIEVYVASFYVSVVCTWFVAFLSLIVLFAPKFWSIWKNRHEPWLEHDPSNERHAQRYGFGSGVGSFFARNGRTAASLGRMPGNLKIAGAKKGASSNGARKESGSTGNTFAGHATPTALPAATTETAMAARKTTESVTEDPSRRSVRSENTSLRDWMKQWVPKTRSAGASESTTTGNEQRDMFSKVEEGNNLHSEGTYSGNRGADEIPIATSPNLGGDAREHVLHTERRNHIGLTNSSAVPAIATAPEAETEDAPDGLLDVDEVSPSSRTSTSGHSTSYVMLSMTQIESDDEPMLQVMTQHTGKLLIRFPSQAVLDHWMSLFSEQDLQDLNAYSFSGSHTRRSSSNPWLASGRTDSHGCTDNTGTQHDYNNAVGSTRGGAIRRRSVMTSGRVEPEQQQQQSYPEDTTEDGIPDQVTPSPNRPHQQQEQIMPRGPRGSITTLGGSTTQATDDSDDSDDLYDPEFGFGGSGGRNCRRNRHNRRGRGFSIVGQRQGPVSASSETTATSYFGPGHAAIIPSADVISAAAAAVSAGWSEADALAAATANSSMMLNGVHVPGGGTAAGTQAVEWFQSSTVEVGKAVWAHRVSQQPVRIPQ
ncbi:Taste receptor type 1 member 3 [Mortierella sp. GBA43]|nr:Taste receptor type 1 member 3 [Mortierella sp. GBA43]